MRYIILFSLLLFISCGQKKGCTNEWASNYEHEAIVDCCCDFDIDKIINEILGTYMMQEKCSGETDTYETIITRDDQNDEGIIISNFNNSGFPIKASWNIDEFDLQTNWVNNNCIVTTTGSVHKANEKLYFIYAAFPSNTCEESKGITCEARSL